jgi:hypothetical protein
MTFYNVLSALLFLGALRVLLLAFEALNWPDIFASGSLLVLVFNDMLSTSHYVESKAEVRYTLPLMFIDLWNFLLLAMAMIVISPSANLFDVQLPRVAGFLGKHSFWALLALYWVFLMWWTHISRKAIGGQSLRLMLWQSSVAVILFVEWLLHVLGLTRPAALGRPLVLVYLVLYLTWIRRQARQIKPSPA